MADPTYHHSQRSRFSVEEARTKIGKRATFTLEGLIVEVRDLPAGPCVVFAPDERFGFGESIGGDLELFEVES